MSEPRLVGAHQLDEVTDALAQGHAIVVPGDGGYQLAVGHEHAPTLAGNDGYLETVVGHRSQATALTASWSKETAHLTNRMWPGPLTVIVSVSDDESDPSGSRGLVVYLTMPAWRPLRKLCRVSGPLAVEALRRADGEAVTSAAEACRHLAHEELNVLFVMDGGPREGPVSTVVDCTVSPPRVRRVGALPESYVEAALLMGARKRGWFTRRRRDGHP